MLKRIHNFCKPIIGVVSAMTLAIFSTYLFGKILPLVENVEPAWCVTVSGGFIILAVVY